MDLRLRYKPVLKKLNNAILIGAIFLNILTTLECATCPSNDKITCPCGRKGQLFFTLCDPEFRERNDPCDKFKFCESCSNDLSTCLTCPLGYSGPHCTIDKENASQNISNSILQPFQSTEKFRIKRSPPCPDLQSPKLGSFRCWFSRNDKECTGKCLPGHSFQNREVEEIVLKCIRGRWVPESSFPPCISEGHCDLEMTGAGSFNCTTNIRGTFCDISCTGHRWVSNRYFCYPGQPWDPPLPHCAKKKGGSNISRVDCKCQNGGTCDVQTETCKCPENFQGRFCQNYVHVYETFCEDPGPIAHGERIYPNDGGASGSRLHKKGTIVIYSCRDGFALAGSSFLTCLESGTWSSARPICNKIPKPETTTTVKPVAKKFCRDPGFIAHGGRWSSEGRASVLGDTFDVGKSVVFSCRAGYALQGLSILTCQESRQWSNTLPECKRMQDAITITTEGPDYPDVTYCEDPGLDPNGQRIEEPWIDAKQQKTGSAKDKFAQGFKLKYSCNAGYVLQGDNTLLCFFTGVWSGSRPICQPIPETDLDYPEIAYCEDPGLDPNGQRIEQPWIDAKQQKTGSAKDKFSQGFKLKYSCNAGYVLQGDNTLLCFFTGVWSGSRPICQPIPVTDLDYPEIAYCEDPGLDPNGQRIEQPWIDAKQQKTGSAKDKFAQGFKLKYSCNAGYVLQGDNTLLCFFTGVWSGSRPICQPIPVTDDEAYCKDPGEITNGKRTVVFSRSKQKDDGAEYPEGIRLKYSCLSGFRMQGEAILMCLKNGMWSATRPRCV